ncbi:MAG: hypothetical protein NTU48_09245 [Legionellales bacterium]|nr:hypothetical protein [Legionellales bacterium]
MNSKGIDYASMLGASHLDEAGDQALPDYSVAKQQISLSRTKSKKLILENTLFFEACSKLYRIGPKLFSANNYELLKKHREFAEEIVVALRPAMLKALFGNYKDPDDVVEDRIFILSVLQRNGIIENNNGIIHDQGWIRFLNRIDRSKLDQYMRVFAQIDSVVIDDPEFFSRVKAHNDLDTLATELPATLAFNKEYGVKNTIAEDTQIKGFTLINEFVCKRTRFFPKAWKIAMRGAWEMPGLETSFELYKLYSERQVWLDGYINFPIIHNFLSYFYTKPIFQTFDAEPLTQVCKLLQSVGVLDMRHFQIIADMPQTALSYCELLHSKGLLDTKHVQDIHDISELTLQHICESNKKQLITLHTLNLLIKLGKNDIDGTLWMSYKPNWLNISKLSDNSLKVLGSLDLNEQVFARVDALYEHDFMQIFDQLSNSQQENLLTNVNYKTIVILLQHLEKIGLLTPENIQSIFDNQARLLEDKQLLQSIVNLEKTNAKRDQKRFNRFMQSPRDRAVSLTLPQPGDSVPLVILSTVMDEQIASRVSQTLERMGIIMQEEDLGVYSPMVLQAFHAVFPLLQEDNLLTQDTIKNMLRLFSSAPDPKVRCRCIIILSQCGLLVQDKITINIGKLELLNQENPALFQEIYAEAWLQTETNTKWLEQTISAGLQESDLSLNAEETLIRRFLIEHEENSAYLALDDTKHRIERHEYPSLVQKTIKLLDKSKLNIESILEALLQTNEEQIKKVYLWLFILDKAELLDSKNAQQIITHRQTVPGDLNFLKTLVVALKAQPEIKISTALKQKSFDQLMRGDVSFQTKQKILDFMNLAIQNPSTGAMLSYMVSDVADVAGEKAAVVQGELKRTAGVFASVATDMGQKAFDKIKLFSAKTVAPLKRNIPELLAFYSSVATHGIDFNGSYYQAHMESLNDDLNALHSQDLLSEPNVRWIVQQPNQEFGGRCLRLLAKANMLKGDDQWQSKVSALSAYDVAEFSKLENKCQLVLSSQEAQEVKQSTVQMWLDAVLQSQEQRPKHGKNN